MSLVWNKWRCKVDMWKGRYSVQAGLLITIVHPVSKVIIDEVISSERIISPILPSQCTTPLGKSLDHPTQKTSEKDLRNNNENLSSIYLIDAIWTVIHDDLAPVAFWNLSHTSHDAIAEQSTEDAFMLEWGWHELAEGGDHNGHATSVEESNWTTWNSIPQIQSELVPPETINQRVWWSIQTLPAAYLCYWNGFSPIIGIIGTNEVQCICILIHLKLLPVHPFCCITNHHPSIIQISKLNIRILPSNDKPWKSRWDILRVPPTGSIQSIWKMLDIATQINFKVPSSCFNHSAESLPTCSKMIMGKSS